MLKTVVGSFDNQAEAHRVVEDLHAAGFADRDISLVANNTSGEYIARAPNDLRVKTPGEIEVSGTAAGAVTGGVLGGAAGLAASLAGLTIPGIGPIIAAGPIVAALAGAGTGAIAGGLIGALTDLGVSRDDAAYYAESVRRGGALVTVKTDASRSEEAADIMRRHDAIDINRRVERWRESGWKEFDANARPYTSDEIARDRALY
jgi:hypothetical protein